MISRPECLSPFRYPAGIKFEDDEGTVFEFSDEPVEAVGEIAIRNRTYFDVAIAQAIVNTNFIDEIIENGGKLIVKHGEEMRYVEYK